MNDKELEEYDRIFDRKVQVIVDGAITEIKDFLRIHENVPLDEELLMLSGSIDRIVIELLTKKVMRIVEAKGVYHK